jgi:hypothetical protein
VVQYARQINVLHMLPRELSSSPAGPASTTGCTRSASSGAYWSAEPRRSARDRRSTAAIQPSEVGRWSTPGCRIGTSLRDWWTGGRQCSCAIPAIRRRCRRISFCWTGRRPCRQHPKFRFAHPSLPCRVNQSFTVSDRYSCRAGGVSVGKHTHVRVRALESRKGDRPVWSRVDEYRGGRASVDTPWPGSIPAKTYCTCFGALMAELPRHHHLIPKRYSIFC